MMKTSPQVQDVSLSKFKRTKIIATVDPSMRSYDALLGLIKAGADGLRLNCSRGLQEDYEEQIKLIRKASIEYGQPVAIIQDLQGPDLYLGDFDGIINVQKGQHISFKYDADYERSGMIPTRYDLSKTLKRGDRLYVLEGRVRTTVSSVSDGVIYAVMENDGIIIKNKRIHLPDTDFDGDIITKKDRQDLAFGSTHDIDYMAFGFVQHAQDVTKLRSILRNLGSKAKIIAKIETKLATENIEQIVKESDAVIISGDNLAIENAPESVPTVQRQIIDLGTHYTKPTIVATEVLATIIESPEPSRTEVSDVSTAVMLGADAVMLSSETASGKYPTEAIKVMKRVILHAQSDKVSNIFAEHGDNNKQGTILSAIINLSEDVNAKAIVAQTRSGATACNIAARRPSRSIIAITPDKKVAQQLAIVYGVKRFVQPYEPKATTKLTNWFLQNKVLLKGDIIVIASGKHPGVVGSTDTIKVRILE